MTFRHFKQEFQKLLFFVFVCVLPLAGNSATEEVINEKRIGVAMRMIGHEVLKSLGDHKSRIMPIEKINEQNKTGTYRIPFEFEFGFDPDDIVSIVDSVMKETKIATDYVVEVEQCETKEIVHSFMIGNAVNPNMIACRGRVLPEDCYSLLITILDGTSPTANLQATTADGSSLTSSKPKEATPFKSVYFAIPMLFLFGFITYLRRKKNTPDVDPNLILIGASQFDKKNMLLSYENKKIELSNKEAELLSLLHTSANAPIEREVILQRVWGDEGDYVGRTLDVFISKLRKKLEADASVKIVNIRGVGYKLVLGVPK